MFLANSSYYQLDYPGIIRDKQKDGIKKKIGIE